MIDKNYAMAASLGITSRLVNTWYPYLKRSPRVLVPIHLDALVVRAAGGQWANCGMTKPVAQGDQNVDLAQFMAPPFADLAGPRPKGIYLHWALPDALTRGSHGADGMSFPGIPDRWLVLRLCPSKSVADRRTIRGWVLQAGEGDAVAFDLDAWKEPGTKPAGVKKPLTALGHGDISWSGYYDNVINRLAFYDALTDVPNGPVAYVVCGWYADETLDPLADENIKSLTEFDAKMNSLGWGLAEKDFAEAVAKSERYTVAANKYGLKSGKSFDARLRSNTVLSNLQFRYTEGAMPDGPPYVTDGSWWPDGTLFHGAVVGIGWPGLGWEGNEKGLLSEETGGPPKPDSLKVVIGNTAAEALAELVERKNQSKGEGQLLEAFQIGAMGELDLPDGRSKVDSLLHAKTFGSQPGGDTVERIWEPPSGPEPKPAAPGTVANPGVFMRYFEGSLPKPGGAVIQAAQPVYGPAAEVNAKSYQMKYIAQENTIARMGYSDVYSQMIYQPAPVYKPGKWKDLTVALPRFFHPTDPVLLIEGVKRSFRHGFDGRFSPDGKLDCRLTGGCLHEYVYCPKDIPYPPIYPEDVLDRGVENGSVPPECNEILGEVAMLDPGSSAPMVVSGNKGSKPAADQMAIQTRSVMVEQTALWSLRDPRVDHGQLVSRSQFNGVIPSMVSITPPNAPWTPLHMDWSIDYIPSAGGVNDWDLGENDFNESVPKLPPAVNPPGILNFKGRSVLTAGVNKALATTVRNGIDQISRAGGAADLGAEPINEAFASDLSQQLLYGIGQMSVEALNDKEKGALEDIATALESMDIVNASLNGFHRGLRGGFPPDGVSAPASGVPSPFIALRAGFIRIVRLRLVDCFGQFVDLAGSSASKAADPALILRTEPLEVTGRPELLAMPPRFTAPARLWLRLMDAGNSLEEACLKTDKTLGASPICGYVMPDHLDRALEFFDAAGEGLGQVRLNENSTVSWEDAPGRPASLGSAPATIIPNKFLASAAQSLIDWGIADAGMAPGKDTALGGLLRVIDSSLWAVDPFGHQADEHLSLLVGHPIAVVRALLRLELREPIDMPNTRLKEIPVRLGALAAWEDGLLGYFVNDDYNTLHCPDPAAAGYARQIGPNTGFLQQANLSDAYYNQFGSDLPAGAPAGAAPVSHPYIDTSGVIHVHPNQDVWLTMFVEPHTLVHATTGLLPRKDIGMRREWVKDALGKLSPTFRFGPILIDPERIRMPIPHDINGTWSWDYRTDVNTWSNGPVTHATQDATLDPDPPQGSEGWLRLTPNPET